MPTLTGYTERSIVINGTVNDVMLSFENAISEVGTLKEVLQGSITAKARYGLQVTKLEFIFNEHDSGVTVQCRGKSDDSGNKAAMRIISKVVNKVQTTHGSGDYKVVEENDSKTNSRKRFRNIFLVILLIGTVIGIRKEGMDFFKADTVKASSWDGSVEIVERFLKNNYLNDPSSYESVKWGHLTKNSDGTYVVTHTFRARNGFGGMNQQSMAFIISADGKSVISYK